MKDQLVKNALEELKEANIRITPQRYAILEYLIEYRNHPTADEIYQALAPQFPSMSVATIYNNLRLFTNIGFVQEMTYGDASSRFDINVHKHYHAICDQCGVIVDFHYPDLYDVEVAAGTITEFTVHSHRLEVYGTCANCQKKKEVKSGSH